MNLTDQSMFALLSKVDVLKPALKLSYNRQLFISVVQYLKVWTEGPKALKITVAGLRVQ